MITIPRREEFWANGKKGDAVCVEVIITRKNSINAFANSEKITKHQIRDALRGAYPSRSFLIRQRGEDWWAKG